MVSHLLVSLLFVGQVSAMEANSAETPAPTMKSSVIQELEKISRIGRDSINTVASEVRSIDLCQTPEVMDAARKNWDRKIRELRVSMRRMKAELLLRIVESSPVDIVTAARFIVKVDDTRLAIRKAVNDFDSAHHISETVGKVEGEIASDVATTRELVRQCLDENDAAVCAGLRTSRDEVAQAIGIIMTEGDRNFHMMESALRNRISDLETRAAEYCKAREANRK